ncbi:MAG: hypothetical protein WCP97_03220 [bacterium]
MKNNHTNRKIKTPVRSIAVAVFIIFIFLSGLVLFRNVIPIVDELNFHYPAVLAVSDGRFTDEVFSRLWMLPGYHIIVGVLARALNFTSLFQFRLISTIISLFSLLFVYLISKTLFPKQALVRTLQFLFFPAVMPFFFLLYTDMVSFAIVLASLWLTLRRRYQLAGFVGTISLFVRQNNVLWIAFYILLIYAQEEGNILSRAAFMRQLKRCWVFLAGGAFFIIGMMLYALNMHGDLVLFQGISGNNLAVALLLFFILFLPLLIKDRNVIRQQLRKPKVLVSIALMYLLCLFSLRNLHPWNQTPLFYIHNIILGLLARSPILQVLLFVPIAVVVSYLWLGKVERKAFALMYPFAFVALITISVADLRYATIPFCLYLLLRKPESPTDEGFLTAYYMVLGTFLTLGTAAVVVFW